LKFDKRFWYFEHPSHSKVCQFRRKLTIQTSLDGESFHTAVGCKQTTGSFWLELSPVVRPQKGCAPGNNFRCSRWCNLEWFPWHAFLGENI